MSVSVGLLFRILQIRRRATERMDQRQLHVVARRLDELGPRPAFGSSPEKLVDEHHRLNRILVRNDRFLEELNQVNFASADASHQVLPFGDGGDHDVLQWQRRQLSSAWSFLLALSQLLRVEDIVLEQATEMLASSAEGRLARHDDQDVFLRLGAGPVRSALLSQLFAHLPTLVHGVAHALQGLPDHRRVRVLRHVGVVHSQLRFNKHVGVALRDDRLLTLAEN